MTEVLVNSAPSSPLSTVSQPNLTVNITTPQRKRRSTSTTSKRQVRVVDEKDGKVYLKHSWTFWYDDGNAPEMTQVGTFNTVQVCSILYFLNKFY